MRSTFKPRCKAICEIVYDSRGGVDKSFNVEVDPRSATVGLNGHYEADTFHLEFDSKLLPFDGDDIASCHVLLYMWDDQAHANRPQDGAGEWAIEDNLMISGLMDDVDQKFVGGDNVTTITGRDYTGLLADAKWDTKDNVPGTGQNLDVVVQKIADLAAPAGATGRFKVSLAAGLPHVKSGSLARSSKKKGMWVKDGKSYWDVIWDLCMQHGFVPRVEGREIVIDVPFVQDKNTLKTAPRLIYGKNLLELSIKRKFQHEIVPQVVIRAWNPVTNKPIEVVYPAKRNVIVRKKDAFGIDIATKKDDQIFYAAPPDVFDKETLLRLAKMRFYHAGRGETTYTLKTADLWIDDVTPGNEVNVMSLRPGQAVGVQFDPFERSTLRSMEIGQRVEHITRLGYRREIASFVANNVERLEIFKQNYYFNKGTLEYKSDEGIDVEIEAVNFAYEPRVVALASASEVLP